ncbi:MAG: hypothetical protein OJF59_000139 [Cytophagales bacterium]|jgi:hypothetical protein|nr:MAG: hypothetical protein OJF59_000139 [Cytophagales bacterium]
MDHVVLLDKQLTMKTITNFIPEIHLHINPINRDMIFIALVGLLAALSALTVLVMAVSQF